MISENAHRETQNRLKRLVAELNNSVDVRAALEEAILAGQAIETAVARIGGDYAKGIEALKEGSEGMMIMSGFGLFLFGGSALGIYFAYGGAIALASLGGLLAMLSLGGFITSLKRVRELNAKQRDFESQLAAAVESLDES